MNLQHVQVGEKFILTDELQFYSRKGKVHIKQRQVFQLLERTRDRLVIGLADEETKFSLERKDEKSWKVVKIEFL